MPTFWHTFIFKIYFLFHNNVFKYFITFSILFQSLFNLIVFFLMSRNSLRFNSNFITFSASLGGIAFGLDLGIISTALLAIKRDFSIEQNFTLELIVSALLFGAFCGVFLCAHISAKYGRRVMIFVENWVSVAGCACGSQQTCPCSWRAASCWA